MATSQLIEIVSFGTYSCDGLGDCCGNAKSPPSRGRQAVRRFVSLALSALVLTFAGSTSSAEAVAPDLSKPSFDCTQAKEPIAQTICGDPKLAEADAVMARLYMVARISAFGHGPSSELAAQRKWLKEREDCRVPDRRVYPSRAECLRGRYADRNHELAVATLFAEPALALETLRKLDPEAAPLYEAIVDYANQARGSTWPMPAERPRILKLLQPSFDRFRTDGNLAFGRDILADAGIKEPADALKSEDKFIEFLQIDSAYLQSDPIPHPLPCAAIIRRPKLLDASDAIFGSTLDNFIFNPDCADTLPPLPALDRLVKTINDTWPDCDGSIRFSAYRMFGSTLNGARVAGAAEISDFAKSGGTRRNVRIPRLRAVSPSLASVSIAELSTYYQTYQRVDANAARVFATSKVHDIMAAGHGCGE
jgi:uncharacterized protein